WLSMDGCMTKSPLAGSKKQARTQQTEGNGA
ncbi:IS5 family transposase, partial [Escherichia coli]